MNFSGHNETHDGVFVTDSKVCKIYIYLDILMTNLAKQKLYFESNAFSK